MSETIVINDVEIVGKGESSADCMNTETLDIPRPGKIEPVSNTHSFGKEVAIQTNVCEIESNCGPVPVRKRFVPLKFSDYCVFANNVKEEDEEEGDVSFAPKGSTCITIKDQTSDAEKVKRGRGRPRKNIDKDVTSVSAEAETEESSNDLGKKHSIVKVTNGFKCSACGKIFTLRGNAKAHLITHTNVKPFQCDFKDCGKSLRTKESLRRHKLSHMGIKLFECSKCHKKFSCNLSLQEHMSLHSGDKPFSCDICGQKFRHVAVLKRHITTHSNNKPFVCGVCGKRFSLKVYVRSHMKTHTGERPYNCDMCNKSFAHASDLNRHKIIHSGKKPYECSICSMRYSDPSSRRRHEREHQNKQQYVCHLCNQQFPRAGQLRVHVVKEHTASATTIDQQNLPFTVEIQGPHGLDKPTSFDSNEESTRLLSLQSNVMQVMHGSQTISMDSQDGERSLVETVQIVLDSAPPDQTDNRREVSAMSLPHAMVNRGQTTGNMEESQSFPPNSTYKLIGTTEGSQVFELKVEKDPNALMQQNLGRDMKIDLQDVKIADGLVALIQDGNTVTVLEPVQTSGQLCMDPMVPRATDQQCMMTKDIHASNSNTDKVNEGNECLSTQNTTTLPKLDSDARSETFFQQDQPAGQSMENVEECTSTYKDVRADQMPLDDANTCTSNISATESQTLIAETPQSTSSLSSDFIENPDFNCQNYYNWLSAFSEECKLFTLPLPKDTFQKISQVQKALSDFMAMPSGVITDINNFKILMGITQGFSQITSSHLSFMFNNLNHNQ